MHAAFVLVTLAWLPAGDSGWVQGPVTYSSGGMTYTMTSGGYGPAQPSSPASNPSLWDRVTGVFGYKSKTSPQMPPPGYRMNGSWTTYQGSTSMQPVPAMMPQSADWDSTYEEGVSFQGMPTTQEPPLAVTGGAGDR